MDTEVFLLNRQEIRRGMMVRRIRLAPNSFLGSMLTQLPLWSLAMGLFWGLRRPRRGRTGGVNWLLALSTPILMGISRRWPLDHLFSTELLPWLLEKIPFLSRYARESS